MRENSIRITVLMPAYNAEKYIEEAIDSVLQQSFTDFELLIINDGSTDSTEEIIHTFNDTRIKLINQLHQGIAAALNLGLLNAKASLIARFDADDICMRHRLEEQVSFLDARPQYVLVGSDAEYISEDGDHLFYFKCIGHTDERIMQKIYFDCPFIHSAVMYRRDAVIKAGGYSVHAHNFEDYFLWMQLKKYGKLYNLSQSLIKVRFNPSSVTIDEKWRGNLFRKMKRDIIRKESITPEDGGELLSIIKSQDTQKIKDGAYYALCGKKFLVDNHQPKKARPFLSKAISVYPYRWDNYAFYFLSFFPKSFINWLHQKSIGKN